MEKKHKDKTGARPKTVPKSSGKKTNVHKTETNKKINKKRDSIESKLNITEKEGNKQSTCSGYTSTPQLPKCKETSLPTKKVMPDPLKIQGERNQKSYSTTSEAQPKQTIDKTIKAYKKVIQEPIISSDKGARPKTTHKPSIIYARPTMQGNTKRANVDPESVKPAKAKIDKFAQQAKDRSAPLDSLANKISDPSFKQHEVQMKKQNTFYDSLHENSKVNRVPSASANVQAFIARVTLYLENETAIKWKTFSTGSYFDYTKVGANDEYDFIIFPKETSFLTPEFDPKMTKKGYCSLKCYNYHNLSEFWRTVIKDDFVKVNLYKRKLFNIFKKYCEDTRRCTEIRREKHSPAFTVSYAVNSYTIDVDLVPGIQIPGWPKVIEKPALWINNDLQEMCFKEYYLVCRNFQKDVKQENLWKISFTNAEKILMKHSNIGKNGFQKNIFQIMKSMLQNIKRDNKVIHLASYHLKMGMLYLFQKWKDDEESDDKVTRTIETLTYFLKICEKKCVYSFFNRDEIISNDIPEKEFETFGTEIRKHLNQFNQQSL